MCGRYKITYEDKIQERIEQLKIWDWIMEQLKISDPDYQFPFEFKPTNSAPVIVADDSGKTELHLMKWGFKEKITNHATGKEITKDIFNTKIENINKISYWKEAFEKRRCLIPVTEWFEWHDKGDGRGKLKYSLNLKDDPVFFFAGIWRPSVNKKTGEAIEEFSIITTVANETVRSVHEKGRMPSIITDKSLQDQWLFDQDLKALKKLAAAQYEDDKLLLKEAK